jgi:urease accessory protein
MPDAASGIAPGLLPLIWLASPALPVGGFSYSDGLEAAIEAGSVQDAASASAWLVAQLHLVQARSDLAVVAQSVAAARAGDTDRLQQLDAWVRQTRETSELRLQAEQMGRSLGDWLRSLHGADAVQPTGWQPTWPVAFGIAAARTGAAVQDACAACAFSWAENQAAAAIKAIPLGQTDGQRILAALAAEIPAAVAHAQSLDDAGRQALAPMLAIRSSQHETQYSRLFRS